MTWFIRGRLTCPPVVIPVNASTRMIPIWKSRRSSSRITLAPVSALSCSRIPFPVCASLTTAARNPSMAIRPEKSSFSRLNAPGRTPETKLLRIWLGERSRRVRPMGHCPSATSGRPETFAQMRTDARREDEPPGARARVGDRAGTPRTLLTERRASMVFKERIKRE